MSGLRVPVFFGSILTLVVLVLQNRTPAFQLTLLGMRSRPFSLGVLVALSVIAGVLLGAILQRTGGRPRSRNRYMPQPPQSQPPESYSGPAEFQTFRSSPETETTDSSNDDFDGSEFDGPTSESRFTQAKGWDTSVSQSWTEQAEKVEEEGQFWSRSRQTPSRRGSVTSIRSKFKRDQSGGPDSPDPVVDAEYRIVPPGQSESTNNNDGFDDNFFDDFFDEEDA